MFFVVSLKKPVEQTLGWPVFWDAMTVIWRRRNLLNSPSMVVAGGLTPIWCQDILNRRGEIGQLHIYRHAFLFLSKLSRGISYFAEVATLPNARDFIFVFFVIA